MNMEAMKLQGVVSDIPMPTESRGARIAREKAEQEAAKAQAKASKNQPITKPKVSMSGADQTILYTPQKQTPTVIDLPKLGRKFKAFMKKSWAIPAFIIMVALVVLATTLINSHQEKQQLADQLAKESPSAESVTISDTPAPIPVTPAPAEPVVPVETPTHDIEPTDSIAAVPLDTYVIQRDDTLWDIAVTLYGDGSRWTEIYENNEDVLVSMDSRNIQDKGHWIHEGISLQLQ
jgi:hypothetical protein